MESSKEAEEAAMKRWMGIALIVVGILLALVAALADVIGLGQDVGAFGWRQLTGTIVGLVIFIAGLAITMMVKPS
jgi:hypothetical protein